MALGVYLGQQEAGEKAHAAALNRGDPLGQRTNEPREPALVDNNAAEAVARKAAEEQREKRPRRFQAEQEKAAREAARTAKEAEAARIKAEGTPIENAELVFHGWKISGFGVIFLGDFSIKNKGVYPIKDFDIRCTISAASGTELERCAPPPTKWSSPGARCGSRS